MNKSRSAILDIMKNIFKVGIWFVVFGVLISCINYIPNNNVIINHIIISFSNAILITGFGVLGLVSIISWLTFVFTTTYKIFVNEYKVEYVDIKETEEVDLTIRTEKVMDGFKEDEKAFDYENEMSLIITNIKPSIAKSEKTINKDTSGYMCHWLDKESGSEIQKLLDMPTLEKIENEINKEEITIEGLNDENIECPIYDKLSDDAKKYYSILMNNTYNSYCYDDIGNEVIEAESALTELDKICNDYQKRLQEGESFTDSEYLKIAAVWACKEKANNASSYITKAVFDIAKIKDNELIGYSNKLIEDSKSLLEMNNLKYSNLNIDIDELYKMNVTQKETLTSIRYATTSLERKKRWLANGGKFSQELKFEELTIIPALLKHFDNINE